MCTGTTVQDFSVTYYFKVLIVMGLAGFFLEE